jgi:hypothetical protein
MNAPFFLRAEPRELFRFKWSAAGGATWQLAMNTHAIALLVNRPDRSALFGIAWLKDGRLCWPADIIMRQNGRGGRLTENGAVVQQWGRP